MTRRCAIMGFDKIEDDLTGAVNTIVSGVADVHPHEMRHTAASLAIAAGADAHNLRPGQHGGNKSRPSCDVERVCNLVETVGEEVSVQVERS